MFSLPSLPQNKLFIIFFWNIFLAIEIKNILGLKGLLPKFRRKMKIKQNPYCEDFLFKF